MIKVTLKPEKGIQIDETKKYLFDPSVVQPYVDASAENATKAEEQANRAEQTFANVSAFVDTSKSEITGIIEQGKTEIATAIDDGRMEISDSILEATEEVKKAGQEAAQEAAQEAVQGAADEATRIATEQVNTYVVEVVSPQIQEFVNNAEADASNAAESAELAAEEANKSSVFASDSQHYAEDSRIWAEGEQEEVQELGGELSSKGWADLAQEKANNAKTSADRAERIAQGFDGVVNTIEGSIGDIGFAPLGVDESQNKRRYLNGQVISQAQFVSFTNKVKAAIQLTPSLATSETNWQAEVTNSKLGQCGKFVIDDTLGTIRLPKVVNINGLQDLTGLGGIKAESLPNITGSEESVTGRFSGAFTSGGVAGSIGGGNVVTTYFGNFDASGSSSTYQDNAPVQQEAIQYPYFIQVATSVEESVDVTREIQLNNPFSLLDYKWSEYELNNASWLISNGAFHSGTVYKAVYELLLKIYNGTETKDGVSVKLHEQMMYAYYLAGGYSYWFTTEKVVVGQDVYGYEPFRVCGKVISVTDTNITIHDDIANSDRTLTRFVNGDSLRSIYTDTDFVLNTADTTFRLPIKVKLASGNAVVGNGMTLGLTDGTNNAGIFTAEANPNSLTSAIQNYGASVGSNVTGGRLLMNKMAGVTTDPTKSGIETSSSGLKLYFYVGETIQDANVINASGVLTEIANADYVVESYNDGTNWYRVYKSGWLEQGGKIVASSGAQSMNVTYMKPFKNNNYSLIKSNDSNNSESLSTANNAIAYTSTTFKTETGFRCLQSSGYVGLASAYWFACGQGE